MKKMRTILLCCTLLGTSSLTFASDNAFSIESEQFKLENQIPSTRVPVLADVIKAYQTFPVEELTDLLPGRLIWRMTEDLKARKLNPDELKDVFEKTFFCIYITTELGKNYENFLPSTLSFLLEELKNQTTPIHQAVSQKKVGKSKPTPTPKKGQKSAKVPIVAPSTPFSLLKLNSTNQKLLDDLTSKKWNDVEFQMRQTNVLVKFSKTQQAAAAKALKSLEMKARQHYKLPQGSFFSRFDHIVEQPDDAFAAFAALLGHQPAFDYIQFRTGKLVSLNVSTNDPSHMENFKEALPAARVGDPLSLNYIGLFHEAHLHDILQAKKWYEKSAQRNNPEAMTNLGNLLITYDKDIEQGIKWYEKAAEFKYPEALNRLGLLYEQQFKDHKRAQYYYELATNQSYPAAMVNLGNMLQNQFQRYDQAKIYFERASKCGYLQGMNNLGTLLDEHYHQHEEAERWYAKAAAGGLEEGKCNLAGYLMLHKKDYVKAKILFEAVVNPMPASMINHGNLLANHFNDIDGAVHLFQKAVEGGFHYGHLSLANHLQDNNPEKEIHFKKAIALGITDAAILYAEYLERQGRHGEASIYKVQIDEEDEVQDIDLEMVSYDSSESPRSFESEDDLSAEKEDSKEEAFESVVEHEKDYLPLEYKLPVPMPAPLSAEEKAQRKAEKKARKQKTQEEIAQKKQTRWEKRYRQAREALFNPKAIKYLNEKKVRTYQDLKVFSVNEAVQEIEKHELRVQQLLSYLANGEMKRARFEQLAGHEKLYSMHINKGDVLVFRINEGDIINGVKAVTILESDTHYDRLDQRVEAIGKAYEWKS